MIKVGQFLSARIDVLPEELTQELAGLQDEVPPENFAEIRKLIEYEFGVPLDERFISFNEAPVAAASLGQVHRARILNENTVPEKADQAGAENFLEVMVKVQRPGIEDLIATDLSALRTVGNWLRRYPPINRRANVQALLEEFTKILYEEIDYLAEGHNAETFAINFRRRRGVKAPAVLWSHTTRRVLALEDVEGIKITDFGAIEQAGVDRCEVAERLFTTYLVQIFEDGIFHADPHPGNLFVNPINRSGNDRHKDEEEDGEQTPTWELAFVDFGMVGRVSEKLRSGLREMAIALGTRDPHRLVRSYQMLGMLLPEADLSLLERVETEVFERFWGKSMSELTKISPHELIEFSVEFRDLLYAMPFQVPLDAILLGRTVGILSGICTGLDPHFNIWEQLTPFAKKLIAEEITRHPRAWLDEIGSLARILLALPRRADAVLFKAERGELPVLAPQLEKKVERLERSVSRITAGLIFAALLVGGIQLYLASYTLLGSVLFGLAGILFLWIILVIR